MDRFATQTLDAQDQAFVESMAGIDRKLESLKIVFQSPRHHAALDALRRANEQLTAAAVTVRPV